MSNRPMLEIADILRGWAGRYIERSRARISWPQHKVMRAIERCRTAALGKHRDQCLGCGHDLGSIESDAAPSSVAIHAHFCAAPLPIEC